MVKQKTIKIDDGRTILLQALGPRTLRLAPLSPEEEKVDEDGNLVSVIYGDNKIVAIAGETIKIDKDVYKIDKIIRSTDPSSTGYHLVIHTLNKSSQLIMPSLGKTRQFFRWGKNFCNCFIGTEENGDYGSSMYLLYRWDGTKRFVEFEEAMVQHPWYTGKWEPDEHHTMYEFCIPKGDSDIETIIRGNYSQISVSGKEQILKFHGHDSDSKMARIFRRDPILREQIIRDLSIDSRVEMPSDAELLSRFDIEQEMYLNKFRIQNAKRTDKDTEEIW